MAKRLPSYQPRLSRCGSSKPSRNRTAGAFAAGSAATTVKGNSATMRQATTTRPAFDWGFRMRRFIGGSGQGLAGAGADVSLAGLAARSGHGSGDVGFRLEWGRVGTARADESSQAEDVGDLRVQAAQDEPTAQFV